MAGYTSGISCWALGIYSLIILISIGTDPEFILPFRLLVNHVYAVRLRSRYYFVWFLSESINNCAGLGFSGYDEGGVARWDLVTNVHVLEIELATALRSVINKWNACSALWLRRWVCNCNVCMYVWMYNLCHV